MSVTAVPLQPIQRGSVRRFWLAMILLAACAIVLAWAGNRQFGRTESGLRYQMLTEGTGASPTHDDFALVRYKGTLPDGTVFDENTSAPMELASTVPGFSEAVTLLKRDTRRFAKRQLSWFRHMKDIEWVDVTDSGNFSANYQKIRAIIAGKFH